MSGVGVSTITPPELTSVKGDSVVQFELAYERYKRQIEEINRSRSASQRITAAGAKACVSAELLRSLVMLKTFDGCSIVSEVEDADVLQWIRARTRCSSDDIPSSVKNALAKVEFKPDRSDPQGSVLQFFADVMTELRRNRVQHALTDSPKAVIVALIPMLQPKIVRESIKDAQEYWPKEKRYYFQHFVEKVTAVSMESVKYIGKRDREVTERVKASEPSKKGRVAVAGDSLEDKLPLGSTDDVNQPVGDSKQRDTVAENKRAQNWKIKCLNKECSEYHPVRECPITSEENKEILLTEYKRRKKELRSQSI